MNFLTFTGSNPVSQPETVASPTVSKNHRVGAKAQASAQAATLAAPLVSQASALETARVGAVNGEAAVSAYADLIAKTVLATFKVNMRNLLDAIAAKSGAHAEAAAWLKQERKAYYAEWAKPGRNAGSSTPRSRWSRMLKEACPSLNVNATPTLAEAISASTVSLWSRLYRGDIADNAALTLAFDTLQDVLIAFGENPEKIASEIDAKEAAKEAKAAEREAAKLAKEAAKAPPAKATAKKAVKPKAKA